MIVNFEWMAVDCVATCQLEDGEIIVESVLFGKETFYMDDASTAVSDEIHALVDEARDKDATDYTDNTAHFGEDL